MGVGLHVHILKTDHIETMLATSECATESNDWPAPAHVVHILRRSKHSLVPVLVLRAGIFIEDNFDRSVQMFTSPGILASVGCRESVFLASEVSDVVHVDVLAVPLILRVDTGDALANRSPSEARLFLIWEKDDNSTHASTGSGSRDVFEAPTHELVGVRIGLKALG